MIFFNPLPQLVSKLCETFALTSIPNPLRTSCMNVPQVAFACRCFGQAEEAVRAAVGYLLEAAGNSNVSKPGLNC